MDIEKEKADFESWATDKFPIAVGQFEKHNNGTYIQRSIRNMYEAWQAAKAHEAEKLKGWVVVPLNNTTIVAIERMVEQQVEASGITDDVFRLDGEKILNAAVEAQEPSNNVAP